MTYQQSDLEILISTTNQKNFDFLFRMFPHDSWKSLSILVVNQTKLDFLESEYNNVRVVNSTVFGLSKSRNLALQNAIGKFVLLSDDDVVFEKDVASKIVDSFSDYNYEALRFQFTKKGKLAKNYPKEFQKALNWFEVLNSSSVELAFHLDFIRKNRLQFDENFGLGAQFPMGEEAVFLADFLEKEGTLGFVPKVILEHNEETTGNKTEIGNIYYHQSAVFFRIFKHKYVIWILLKLFFDCKQQKIKWGQIPHLIAQALKGKKEYVKYTRV